jgi:hypothetical protein
MISNRKNHSDITRATVLYSMNSPSISSRKEKRSRKMLQGYEQITMG